MIPIIISAVLSFISTNIDDIFVLMILFSKANSNEKKRYVCIGQYIGIGMLVLISVLGALGISIISEKYIGFLGFIPIFIGIKELYKYKRCKVEENDVVEVGDDSSKISTPNLLKKYIPADVIKVCMISIANGADNIGIYIPMFTTMTPIYLIVTIIIFAFMIGLWCIFAIKLVNYPFIKDKIEKYKDILVPVIFIMIGTFILIESGALSSIII